MFDVVEAASPSLEGKKLGRSPLCQSGERDVESIRKKPRGNSYFSPLLASSQQRSIAIFQREQCQLIVYISIMSLRPISNSAFLVVVFAVFAFLSNQGATAAETNVLSEKIEIRSFGIAWVTLLRGLQSITNNNFAHTNHSGDDVNLATFAFFKAVGVDLTAPGRGIYFPQLQSYLEVKATPAELEVVERSIAKLNKDFPQIHFQARFIKVSDICVGFILQSGITVSTNEISTTEIIPAEKLRPLLRGIYDNYQYLTYAELENVTTSGQLAQRSCDDLPLHLCETNCAIDVVPKLSANDFMLNLEAAASEPEKLAARATVWDGQTVAMIPPKSAGTNRMVVFITTRVVDSIGYPIHSDEELFSRERKIKTVIPPQQ